ncbi:MAG: structural protein [Caudoviricetes sp.]|nr:MAG: structural protein [Caudoviricetes sp.]
MSLLEKCNPNLQSRSFGKIDSNSTAWFTKIREPQQCNIFGFRNSEIDNGKILFSKQYSDRPDEIICGLEKCNMTGTLFVIPETLEAEDTDKTVVMTEIDKNGEPFQYGYLRVIVNGAKGDKFNITVKNKGSENGNTFNIELKEDGWNAVVLEIFNPDVVLGDGWVGETVGFLLLFEPQQQTEFSLSTIELFENAYDLVKDSTIGFTCVTDFSGDPTLTITEDTCSIPSYDETATTIERSITATKIIGEVADFGNLYKRIDKSQFPVKRTGNFEVAKKELNGVSYGAIEIPDLATIQCPHLVVQPQNCEYDILKHIQLDGATTKVTIPEDMFFIEDETVYVKDTYVGEKFIIAYPRMENGTAWEITTQELNKANYYMEMITPIGKDEYYLKADNVFATALPLTWTSEAGTMTIPYSMAKDGNGKFGTFVKLDNSK